jgi:hypothetical protein
MSLRQRYARLGLWQKLGLFGSLASIVSLVGLFSWTDTPPPPTARPVLQLRAAKNLDGGYFSTRISGTRIETSCEWELKNVGDVMAVKITQTTGEMREGSSQFNVGPAPRNLSLAPGEHYFIKASVITELKSVDEVRKWVKEFIANDKASMTLRIKIDYSSALEQSKEYLLQLTQEVRHKSVTVKESVRT